MKLDKVWNTCARVRYELESLEAISRAQGGCANRANFKQDNSGTIERDEFLSLPQISSNPLATRYGTTMSEPL